MQDIKLVPKQEPKKEESSDAIEAALAAEPKVSTKTPQISVEPAPVPEAKKGLTTESGTTQDLGNQSKGERKWFDPRRGAFACPKCQTINTTRVYKGSVLVRQCCNPDCLHAEEFQ